MPGMPKIIGSSLDEHRERTREKIFAALGDLLESEDFEQLTFSRIAQAAGVGRTAMYNHFPDQGTLLVEYTLHETTDYLRWLREGTSRATTPREALDLYVRTQVELRDSFHMPQGSLRTKLAPETARRMREHVILIEGVLRGILHEGMASGAFDPQLDVDATVRIVNALLIGGTVASSVDTEALVGFIDRGVGALVPSSTTS